MVVEIRSSGVDVIDTALIKKATRFFLKKLVYKRRLKKVGKVHISIVNRLSGLYGDVVVCDKMDGLCDIRIRLQKTTNFLVMLATLAHECVHAAQNINGFLRITEEGFFWKGESYGNAPYFVYEGREYERLPWEREAYDKEEALAKSFINHYYELNR